MPARPGVRARVSMGRVITAQGRAAGLTGAQVHPLGADLHAFGALAPPVRQPHPLDRREVRADARGQRRLRHSLSARCTNLTAMEPSPTAGGTRLTLPAPTTPTPKIPGRLNPRR